MNTKMRTWGAVASAMLLATGSATAFAAPGEAAELQTGAEAAQEAQIPSALGHAGTVQRQNVEGVFSFDQAVTTTNDDIARFFARAASALCGDMPEYSASSLQRTITFRMRDKMMDAYVADLAEGASDSRTIGCACSSNASGGGAIANAEASGVSVGAALAAVQAL